MRFRASKATLVCQTHVRSGLAVNRCTNGKPIELKRALGIAIQIADGLAEAHRCTHRYFQFWRTAIRNVERPPAIFEKARGGNHLGHSESRTRGVVCIHTCFAVGATAHNPQIPFSCWNQRVQLVPDHVWSDESFLTIQGINKRVER